MASFVERHGLWSAEQRAAADQICGRLDAGEVDTVRFAWPDQHGILRGKTLVAGAARGALESGVNLTSTLLAKDTSHKTVLPVFTAGGFGDADDGDGLRGGADITIVPDPTTWKMLPWTPRTGWVLCDAYLADGRPCPLGTRQILQRGLARLANRGYALVAGLEVECHLFKLDDPNLRLADAGQPGTPPSVSLLTQGYQYLTELRFDRVGDLMELLRSQLVALGLPLHSLEVEFGPSQFEFVFAPTRGTEPADTMVLLRSAVKQICARHGYHATFMCRPRIPNVMSSGWHLHQSLARLEDGANAFVPDAGADAPLSALGLQWLAGLKAHAVGGAALACPTINGYRRFRPYSLAPDRASWAADNRGAMLRVIGGADQPASRIENRAGEPAANPYLYLAAQVIAGLNGLERRLDPGPSADAPYDTPADPLPRSLGDALVALRADPVLVEGLGPRFVKHWCAIKEAELARFALEVSEWEHREYFELF